MKPVRIVAVWDEGRLVEVDDEPDVLTPEHEARIADYESRQDAREAELVALGAPSFILEGHRACRRRQRERLGRPGPQFVSTRPRWTLPHRAVREFVATAIYFGRPLAVPRRPVRACAPRARRRSLRARARSPGRLADADDLPPRGRLRRARRFPR